MKRMLLAAALMALATSAQAAKIEVTLQSHELNGNPYPINPVAMYDGDIAFALPTYWYDPDINELSSEGITHWRISTRKTPAPIARHFDRFILDLNIRDGSAAGSAGYSCINGAFSYAVMASMCGNYNFGDNGVDESHVVYLGTQAYRVMGGDDQILGDTQTLADYNLALTLWDGQSLILGTGEGMRLVFSAVDSAVVPVPAAGWLLGTALGLLGVARKLLAKGQS